MKKVFVFFNVILSCTFLKTAGAAEGAVPAVLSGAEGYSSCREGQVLYSDLQCYEAPFRPNRGGVEPAGIVYDAERRLAVSLESVRLPWGGRGKDIRTLDNCGTDFDGCQTDGMSNTSEIVAALGDGRYAAAYCYRMTGGLPEGSWFLPSAEQLKQLFTKRELVNNALKNIGGRSLQNAFYWSSNENRSADAVAVGMEDGGAVGSYKDSLLDVRCFTAY